MFDACSACRRRLAKRSEGNLPRSQWARLEAHLCRCRACRRIDEADRALHMALSITMMAGPASRMSRDAAEAFDDRVLNMVLNQHRSLLSIWLEELVERLRRIKRSFESVYLTQFAGGAFAAAAVTAACLFVAMRPHVNPAHTGRTGSADTSVTMSFLNGPPVPLENLLDTASPRTALLWTRPARTTRRSVAEIDGNTKSAGNSGRDTAAHP